MIWHYLVSPYYKRKLNIYYCDCLPISHIYIINSPVPTFIIFICCVTLSTTAKNDSFYFGRFTTYHHSFGIFSISVFVGLYSCCFVRILCIYMFSPRKPEAIMDALLSELLNVYV